MKTIIAIPADDSLRNVKFNMQFINSFNKFHPDIEIRFFPTDGSPDYYYRAKPIIACQLFEEGYEYVILADNDQIIIGSLNDILNDEDEFDVGVVLNDPSYPINLLDGISPYFNNGLVLLKSHEFAKHWKRLCFTPHFKNFQFREQDLLNIMCSDYMNYKVKMIETEKLYGECAKPFWAQAYLEEGKIFIDTQFGKKQLCIIHFGGGNTPDKGNYKIRFKPEVVAKIEELIK